MNANVKTRTEQSHLLCDECGSEFFKNVSPMQSFAQTVRIYCMGLTTVSINLKRVALNNAVVMGKLLSR